MLRTEMKTVGGVNGANRSCWILKIAGEWVKPSALGHLLGDVRRTIRMTRR